MERDRILLRGIRILLGFFIIGLVLPLALICGPIRNIPFFWQLIDCSFGIVGFILLWLARKYTLELVSLRNA